MRALLIPSAFVVGLFSFAGYPRTDAPDLVVGGVTVEVPSRGACISATQFIKQPFLNNGQTAYQVQLTNICATARWYKACYINSQHKWVKDSGHLDAFATETTYLLNSGSSTPGSFIVNDAATSTGVFPYACSQPS